MSNSRHVPQLPSASVSFTMSMPESLGSPWDQCCQLKEQNRNHYKMLGLNVKIIFFRPNFEFFKELYYVFKSNVLVFETLKFMFTFFGKTHRNTLKIKGDHNLPHKIQTIC